MKLYDLVKDKIPHQEGVISDNEMLLFNRRDFIYSETSTTRAFLQMFGATSVTYEMYAIIDLIQSITCKISPGESVDIVQISKTMTLPTLAIRTFLPESNRIYLFAPNGLDKINATDNLSRDIAERFNKLVNYTKILPNGHDRLDSIKFILCNATDAAEVLTGLELYSTINRGILIIKGYSRAKAPNCGDAMLAARLNIHCNISGFGLSVAI